jgi:IclR family transcriptional regulator, KDG regulon repressor
VLGTVCRAGDLLELFDQENPEWGATAVSKRLDITKSQAHEMLVSLEAIGLLRRAARGRFRLGWKTVSLSQRLMKSEFTAGEARLVQQLGRHTDTSVDLITFDGDRCVRIGGHGPSNHSRGPVKQTGVVSATGKVLLAGMGSGRAEALVPDLDLELELAAVRERQIAFEDDEERRGVAAPVIDADGAVLAALGVTVDPDVWNAKGSLLTRAVTGTAKRLSDSVRQRHTLSFVMGEPALAEGGRAANMAV